MATYITTYRQELECWLVIKKHGMLQDVVYMCKTYPEALAFIRIYTTSLPLVA